MSHRIPLKQLLRTCQASQQFMLESLSYTPMLGSRLFQYKNRIQFRACAELAIRGLVKVRNERKLESIYYEVLENLGSKGAVEFADMIKYYSTRKINPFLTNEEWNVSAFRFYAENEPVDFPDPGHA